MVFPFAANFHLSLSNQPSIVVAIILGVLVPCVTSLSFNFTSFSPNDLRINYTGLAIPVNQSIQLTPNAPNSTGKAIYAEPLQLWDKTSGKFSDFTTYFSFVINSHGQSKYADGLAFFIGPTYSSNPDKPFEGRSLGLGAYSYVAVEFDIFQNYEDPLHDHVGIDINNVISLITTPWFSNITAGKKNDAWITYDSRSMNLSIEFTGFKNGTIVRQNLSQILDLRQYLPEQVIIGFSASTGKFSAAHSICSWNFSSTLQIDPPTVGKREKIDPSTKSKSKIGLVIGLIIVGPVLIGGLGILLVSIWKRMRRWRRDFEDDTMLNRIYEFERGNGPKKFSYIELARATHNFAEHGKLGEGGFGGVYKAYMTELNTDVAVKRVSKESKQGKKEYASEVTIISRLSHINLVKLIGWCHEKGELLLVYQFMHNGSLDSHLFQRKCLLTWEMRYKISKGIATALLYLHEEWEQCVLHRDIKSSNVMLDSEFNAKLGDFGLARLVDHEKGSQTTLMAGTMGYMAPEIYIEGKASKETDVYSFGIVALEIACGRKPINLRAREGEVNLVEWVWSLYGTENLLEAVDSKLSFDFNEQEVKHLMIVGLWCAHPDSNARPSISDAIGVLNFQVPLPFLPSIMPLPTY